MHKPIIGGSRRNPLPETPAPKPAKQEAQHAVPVPAHETSQEGQKPLTEAEVMALYYAHRGSCPLCGKVMKKGITGHLSKCLPIYNFEIKLRTS